MKTLPLFVTIAALAALTVVPFALEITAAVLFTAGLFAILFADYTRTTRRLKLPVAAAPALAAGTRTERFGLAA